MTDWRGELCRSVVRTVCLFVPSISYIVQVDHEARSFCHHQQSAHRRMLRQLGQRRFSRKVPPCLDIADRAAVALAHSLALANSGLVLNKFTD